MHRFDLSNLKLINVNFPLEPHGIRWARQSVRAYSGQVVEGEDPMGRRHYWFAATPLIEPEEDTDRWAVEHGYVSLTPLRLNLTDEERLDRLMHRDLSVASVGA